MNESTIFLLTFIIYILSALFYFSFQFSKKDKFARTGYALAVAGLILHTAALIVRTVESKHAPFTNMYESLSFLAWSSILAYVIIEKLYKIKRAGAYFLLIVIALMALASSPAMPKGAAPLVPALQSYWLWLHVSVTMLGEAFFAVALVTSMMYLVADSKERKGKPLSPASHPRGLTRSVTAAWPSAFPSSLWEAWCSAWSGPTKPGEPIGAGTRRKSGA